MMRRSTVLWILLFSVLTLVPLVIGFLTYLRLESMP